MGDGVLGTTMNIFCNIFFTNKGGCKGPNVIKNVLFSSNIRKIVEIEVEYIMHYIFALIIIIITTTIIVITITMLLLVVILLLLLLKHA